MFLDFDVENHGSAILTQVDIKDMKLKKNSLRVKKTIESKRY